MSPTKSINKKMVENSGDFEKKKSIPERLWLFFLNEKRQKKKKTEKDPERTFFPTFFFVILEETKKKSPKSWKRKKINNRTLVDFDFPAKTAKQNPTKTKTKLNRKKKIIICVSKWLSSYSLLTRVHCVA